MVNWSCGSALCYKKFITRDEKGATLEFYRLPSDKVVQARYKQFFKTSGFNWKNGHNYTLYDASIRVKVSEKIQLISQIFSLQISS